MAAGSDPGSPQDAGTGLLSAVQQEIRGFDQARQASQGAGVQYNYFGPGAEAESGVSIAAPLGQLDERLPMRGRDALLSALMDSTDGLRVRVVHGLGGCGKTRLALEVATQLLERGVEVWWVSAAEESRLAAGMQAIARRVGVTDAELRHGDAADLLWQRLAARQQEWLLVIDNADDPQVLAGPDGCVGDGTGWLRPLRASAGMVLATSRDGRPSSWGPWCGLYRVEVLASGQAAQVLVDHAGGYEELGSAGEAEALAQRLGRLPLALKIAGSFLAESVVIPAAFAAPGVARTYSQYLAAIEGGQLETVFPAPSAGELTPEQARKVIGRTWDLTLDLLTARQMPEARRVLRLLACFADAPIPHELALDPQTLRDSPLLEGISGPRLWQVLETLAGFGLIDLISTDSNQLAVVRLHPLVRDTSRPDARDPDEREAYLVLAAELLRRAAEQADVPEDPAMWSTWQVLGAHAIYIFDTLTASSDCPDEAATAASNAVALTARYQSAQGLYSQAEEVQRRILGLRFRVLGADHPDTLTTRHEIARMMAARGDHAGAEAEYRDVLAATLRVLGADHPDTLATRHAIAYEMAERGDHAGAEAEYRDVLAAKLPVLGADHHSTLNTRHAIAYEMAERGDHAGAEAEYRDVLAARLRVLGADHPDTLATRHEIARMMAARGDHAGAEAEYRDVLAAKLPVLGADHPSTLNTRHAIAYEMAERGDHPGAEAEYRDVLAAKLPVLGADHPDTLATRHEIARMMAARGDHAGAEAEYRDVLAAKLPVLGADHPSTLNTRHAIAYEMAERGDHPGAEAEYRDVLAAKLPVLGADHPDTLATRHEIARMMAARGDHAGAEAEYRDVLAAKLPVLGADHPDTLATRHEIARMMAARGDHAGAEAEYRDVLAARLPVLGADHPSTLNTRHAIAYEMAARGDHPGAEAEYRDVLAATLPVLGADHPDTLATRHEIARMMAARGDHPGAEAE